MNDKPFYFVPTSEGISWETNAPIDWCKENLNKKCYAVFHRETGVRTLDQNASIHLWMTQVAQAFNDKGFFVNEVLEQMAPIAFTTPIYKECIWRPKQISLVGKKSSTKLDKVNDINVIYDYLNKNQKAKFGIDLPFPSEETKL